MEKGHLEPVDFNAMGEIPDVDRSTFLASIAEHAQERARSTPGLGTNNLFNANGKLINTDDIESIIPDEESGGSNMLRIVLYGAAGASLLVAVYQVTRGLKQFRTKDKGTKD